MESTPKSAVIRQKDALPRFKSVLGELANNVLLLADDKLKAPFEVSLSTTILSIGPSVVQILESDGSDSTQNSNKKAIQPEGGIYNEVALSTLDFSDGTGTGDLYSATATVDVAVPASEYIWMGIEKRPDNKIYLIWGTPNAVDSSATYPIFGSGNGFRSIGMVLLQDDGTGSSGSSWNFVAPTIQDFIIFEASGGGGGGGSGSSTAENFKNAFDELPYPFGEYILAEVSEDTILDGSSDATYNLANKTYDFALASDILLTTNLLKTDFLDSGYDIGEVYVRLEYSLDDIDTNPTVDISRDAGNEYQSVTLERIQESDTYIGKLAFAEEASNQTLDEYAVGNADGTVVFTNTVTKIAQPILPTNTEVLKKISVYLNKLGTITGFVRASIVNDDTGEPSENTDKTVISTNWRDIDSLSGGNITFSIDVEGLLKTGVPYWLLVEVDSFYQADYNAGVDELAVRVDSSAPTIDDLFSYNGAWAVVTGSAMVYLLEGRILDLRAKITASQASKLEGFSVFFGESTYLNNDIPDAAKWQEVFVDTSVHNHTITVGSFTVDEATIKVFIPSRGQVFKPDPDTFTVVGQQLQFVDDFFYDGLGTDLRLIVQNG